MVTDLVEVVQVYSLSKTLKMTEVPELLKSQRESKQIDFTFIHLAASAMLVSKHLALAPQAPPEVV